VAVKPAATATASDAASNDSGTIGEVDPKAANSTGDSAAAAKPAGADAGTAKPATAKKLATAAASKSFLKKKSSAQSAAADVGGVKPLVLVPPSQGTVDAAGSQDSGISPSQGGNGQLAAVPAAPPATSSQTTHKKTIFDLFKGSTASTDAAPSAPAETVEPVPQPQQPQTQVASLPATKTPAAPSAASSGSGFVIQLSSFPSQSEAQTEYGRLRSKYPSVVGSLAPRITPASIGGSTRYQLGLGPVTSRDQATQVCSSLFASGERDCLVRKQ
jgi:cell division septation protein DedD